MMGIFNYNNTETKNQQGGKIVRKVSIKNGKGYKSITKYRKGKKLYTVKKPIHKEHIKLIKKGKFIPGLFRECCKTKKKRAGRYIRGGMDEDLEFGRDSPTEYMKLVPADPERFKNLEDQERRKQLLTPVSAEQVEEVFAGPNPKQKETIENELMKKEDLMDPYGWNNLNTFSG